MQYHPTWHAHYSHLESFVSQHKKIHIELYIISGTYHWCHSWVSRFRIIGPIYNTIPDNTMLQFSCKFDGFTWFVFWWAHLAQIMRKLGGVGWGARGILLKNGRGRGPRVKKYEFWAGCALYLYFKHAMDLSGTTHVWQVYCVFLSASYLHTSAIWVRAQTQRPFR